jgi:hypothetical protein
MQTQGRGKDGREMAKHVSALHAFFRNAIFEEQNVLFWSVVIWLLKKWFYKNSALGSDLTWPKAWIHKEKVIDRDWNGKEKGTKVGVKAWLGRHWRRKSWFYLSDEYDIGAFTGLDLDNVTPCKPATLGHVKI